MSVIPEGAIEGLVAAAVLVPSLATAPLLPWAWQQHRQRSSAIQRDARCLELASCLGTAIHCLQVERGQTVALLSGGSSPALASLQQKSDTALGAVRQALGLSATARKDTGETLLPPAGHLTCLYGDSCCKLEQALSWRKNRQARPAVVMQDYSIAIAALLAFTSALVTQSQRGMAADLGQAWVNLLAAGECAARERGLMNAALSSSRFSGVPRQLQDLIDEQEVFLSQVCLCSDRSILALLQEHGTPSPALLQMRTALLNSEQVAPSITAADWFSTSSRRIDAMKSVGDALATRMKASLQVPRRPAGGAAGQVSRAGQASRLPSRPLLSAAAGTALALLALVAWGVIQPAPGGLTRAAGLAAPVVVAPTAIPPAQISPAQISPDMASPAHASLESRPSRDSGPLQTAAARP